MAEPFRFRDAQVGDDDEVFRRVLADSGEAHYLKTLHALAQEQSAACKEWLNRAADDKGEYAGTALIKKAYQAYRDHLQKKSDVAPDVALDNDADNDAIYKLTKRFKSEKWLSKKSINDYSDADFTNHKNIRWMYRVVKDVRRAMTKPDYRAYLETWLSDERRKVLARFVANKKLRDLTRWEWHEVFVDDEFHHNKATKRHALRGDASRADAELGDVYIPAKDRDTRLVPWSKEVKKIFPVPYLDPKQVKPT